MEYTLSADLWPPQSRGVRGVLDEWALDVVRFCTFANGWRETRQAVELFKWAAHHGMSGCLHQPPIA